MARLAETERRTALFSARRRYQLLVTGFLRHLLELHLELVDEIERELAPADADPAPGGEPDQRAAQ